MTREGTMPQYFIKVKSEEKGPYVRAQLESMWNQGQITADAMYWEVGSNNKRPILEMFSPQVAAVSNPTTEETATSTSGSTPVEEQIIPRVAARNACPACGSSDSKIIGKSKGFNFAADRECCGCRTRWTPACSKWGGLIYAVVGVAAVVLSALFTSSSWALYVENKDSEEPVPSQRWARYF